MLARARQILRRMRQTAPMCGAARRTDGEPCRNFPLENGRCKFHGGLVPKGKNWHRVQPAHNPKRTLAKLHEIEARQAKQRKRFARMTPEEREAHQAWQASHNPNPRKRWERRVALEARELLRLADEKARAKDLDE
ncbi:HGGxSTG domain-containing protein [Pseudoxanthobacter sp. M-2]|uniref:HGGxSTG domain-containing protein n=1 Tax=Pseudoxanthobacter sp. M-2 TaxID=3078754 RepID=UPI0038FCA3C9